MTDKCLVEVNLTAGVVHLAEWWISPGNLCRLYPMIDVFLEVGKGNRDAEFSPTWMKVPGSIGVKEGGDPERFGHGFGEERG